MGGGENNSQKVILNKKSVNSLYSHLSHAHFDFGKIYPIITDIHDVSGSMSGHYFHQDLYVARQIYKNNPKRHLDIASRIDGFVAHVASFRDIDIMDIRPNVSKVKGINFTQADLMDLTQNIIGQYDSISSLHAIEHFGLGRYGDPIDYFGYLKAIENIAKMLHSGGFFYFSVPMGSPQRIEYNAHRVFSLVHLKEILEIDFSIIEFSYINDAGDFYENIKINEANIESSCGCKHGCGVFILIKK